MSNTEFNSALAGAGNKSASALITATEGRGIYVVKDAESPTTLLPGAATYLIFNGIVFWYDSTDALTAHDGVSCCVTADGKRFKAFTYQGAQIKIYPVISKALTAPPVSPAAGDSYIVAAGGTGAWAGKDKKIASYSARGWEFTTPRAFDMARVDAETLIYHYSAAGVWTAGFPALSIASDAVLHSMLFTGKFGLAVINQTTNAPPGLPANKNAYVIGGSPTGAWAGHAREIAIYQTSAWAYYTPYEGALVYDVSIDAQVKFDGTQWVALISGYSKVVVAGNASLENSANLTDVNYDPTAAPAFASSNHKDTSVLNFTPSAAGKLLEIEYNCQVRFNIVSGTGASCTAFYIQVGLQIDAAASAADFGAVQSGDTIGGATPSKWHEVKMKFFYVTVDALAHDYSFHLFLDHTTSVSSGPPANIDIDIVKRSIIIREIA